MPEVRRTMERKRASWIWIVGLLVFIAPSCQRAPSTPAVAVRSSLGKNQGMVLIKGGAFLMGTDDGMPYEAPAHEVAVNSFWMDEHEVTVAEFAKFVAATGYQTDAEKFG